MIKENDFIEIEFTGKIKEDGFIFDTTSEDVAKEHGLAGQGSKFGPKVVCVGQGQLIPGLDKDILGKETGKEYTAQIQPEDGFGKKSAKNVQLIPTSQFKKQKINPVPGLQVNIDDHIGIIKTVTGGRTLVDFNHPLSSKELVYTYKVNKIITDTEEKAKNYVSVMLGLPAEVKYSEGELKMALGFPLDDNIQKMIEEKITEVIPEIKKVVFEHKKETEKNTEEQ